MTSATSLFGEQRASSTNGLYSIFIIMIIESSGFKFLLCIIFDINIELHTHTQFMPGIRRLSPLSTTNARALRMTKATITMCVTEALKISKQTKRNFQHPFRSIGWSSARASMFAHSRSWCGGLRVCVCVSVFVRRRSRKINERKKRKKRNIYIL